MHDTSNWLIDRRSTKNTSPVRIEHKTTEVNTSMHSAAAMSAARPISCQTLVYELQGKRYRTQYTSQLITDQHMHMREAAGLEALASESPPPQVPFSNRFTLQLATAASPGQDWLCGQACHRSLACTVGKRKCESLIASTSRNR